jgi:hypothetical protein
MIPNSIEVSGYAIVPDILHSDRITELVELLSQSLAVLAGRGGRRNLLDEPAVSELSSSPELRRLVEPILGKEAFAVRGILFDKTPDANWKVPWHQDVTIAVKERSEIMDTDRGR